MAIIAISTWISLICAGSRVNSGSMCGLGRLDDEVHPVGRHVDARHRVHHSLTWAMTMPPLKAGGLDDGRRVLGVGAGVEVALGIGRLRGDQRDLGREVDEVAANSSR
jgi:hypothetical protein